MARDLISRVAVLCLMAATLGAQQPAPQSAHAGYTQVAKLPDTINGKRLATFATDRKAGRLYAGSIEGLYWVDLREAHPVWKGPIIKKDIIHIEFAPEVQRVFFATRDDIGYVNVDALEQPHMIAHLRAHDFAYESTRKEIYVSSRDPLLRVFDARTGESSGTIELPGWQGLQLEALPGRVLFSIPNKDGLYAVNAATHTVAPWQVSEKIVTPATIEADPDGRFVFLAYYQNIVAIDAATAKVVGRVATPFTASIAFDADANLLVAAYYLDPPPIRVKAFRADANGLTEVSNMHNPAIGGIGVEPTSRGFIQAGAHQLLVWTLNEK